MGVHISETSSGPQPHFHEHGHDWHLDEHNYRRFQRSLEGKIKEHGVLGNKGLSKTTTLIMVCRLHDRRRQGSQRHRGNTSA